MTEYISNSPEETQRIAKEFSRSLKPGDIVAMRGGLGAGKTAFTAGVAAGLGIERGVSSPTYALINHYRGKYDIYHFDMYRISSYDDLASTGFFDYLDCEAVLLIEWSENIEEYLPDDIITVSMEVLGENTRKIVIEKT